MSEKTKRMDKELSSILKKDPKMIRFYAARMLIELDLGKRLTKIQQHKVFNKCRIGILEVKR